MQPAALTIPLYTCMQGTLAVAFRCYAYAATPTMSCPAGTAGQGPAGGRAPTGEHLVEGDDKAHGAHRAEAGARHQVEHIVAHHGLLPADLGHHGVPARVVPHDAGPPPVGALHHVRCLAA